MTHEERIRYLEGIPTETVSPTQAAQVLNCQPYALNLMAKAGQLAFPYYFSGNRPRISKAALMEFIGG